MKAMLPPRRRVGVRELWFTSKTSSMRTTHYRANPKACAYFCDRRFFRGVMLKGEMEVLTGPEIKREIRREGDERYYPGGVDDPDYCVLHFIATVGRHYSNFHSVDFSAGE